jgi:hypothetical protein
MSFPVSFPYDDTPISGPGGIPFSECDIRINYNDNCKIIAAANNANNGAQQIFYFNGSDDLTWHITALPLGADKYHRNPSVDWTSDGIAWAITTGSSQSDFPDQIRFLRCYFSTENGATWQQHGQFTNSLDSSVQNSIKSSRMWIDHTPGQVIDPQSGNPKTYNDSIYVIWSNDTKVWFRIGRKFNMQPSYTFGDPILVNWVSPGTMATGNRCDITTDAWSGYVYAFWTDKGVDMQGNTNPDGSLFFAKFSNDGGGIQPAVKITQGFGSLSIPIPSFTNHTKSISGGAYQTVQKIDYTSDDTHTSKNAYVYVVWADLNGGSGCDSPTSIVTSSCRTRIWFSRSINGGTNWDKPMMINDSDKFNDQFHPRLAVDQTNGQIVVVYYDTINDPGRHATDIWMQTSEDNGLTWSPPKGKQVTLGATDETTAGANSKQYGGYIGLTGYAGTFFPSWTDRRSGVEEIWTRLSRVPSAPEQLCNKTGTSGGPMVTSEPILTSAKVTLITVGEDNFDPTDDKDQRTHVTVDVNTARNENAAHIDSDFKRFDDGGSGETDSYSLQINGPWFAKSRIQKGYVRIRVDPTGDDTWDFLFSVDLKFSDSSAIHVDKTTNTNPFSQSEDGAKEFYVNIASQSVIDITSSPWL